MICITPRVHAIIQRLLKEPTEIAFYGVRGDPARPHLVTSIIIPKQHVSTASAEPTEEGLLDLAEHLQSRNLDPITASFWFHTHPSGVTSPSSTDWKTFDESFEKANFGFMGIFSKCGWAKAYIFSRTPLTSGKPSANTYSYDIKVDWTYSLSEEEEASLSQILKDCVSSPPPVAARTIYGSYDNDLRDWYARHYTGASQPVTSPTTPAADEEGSVPLALSKLTRKEQSRVRGLVKQYNFRWSVDLARFLSDPSLSLPNRVYTSLEQLHLYAELIEEQWLADEKDAALASAPPKPSTPEPDRDEDFVFDDGSDTHLSEIQQELEALRTSSLPD